MELRNINNDFVADESIGARCINQKRLQKPLYAVLCNIPVFVKDASTNTSRVELSWTLLPNATNQQLHLLSPSIGGGTSVLNFVPCLLQSETSGLSQPTH
eukprot:Protomagalhaensia_wolfi_Nauph_80__2061@NODE_2317_length_1128_cov_6_134986_g1815_i0_p1_GENE_NODE_2317_length_1128_cov_6_134986_g1815_i0NODE_2317_length_1128_cov_6_134986_g1815_i0_p1_ORF_typecomplete_len100_score9_94_NODE_2317_length_1128_cov_6_134986_g1815_i0361660